MQPQQDEGKEKGSPEKVEKSSTLAHAHLLPN
jgi:hypothetical protein